VRVGVRIDDDGTTIVTERELTAPGADVPTFVVAAREDRQLAGETAALLA
jgi:hypothetical protein